MTITDAASAPTAADPLAFLDTGGEMAGLIRGLDWSASPLGPPETWLQALRTALRLLLASPQPMWLGWGTDPEALVFLYNDAYRPILARKHPLALGRPIVAVWPEIWEAALPPIRAALRGPGGVHVESRPLVMERGDRPEEVHYTFSLTPVAHEDGSVAGLLCTNDDETRQVIGRRQLATLAELAARTAGPHGVSDLCDGMAAALATNARDLPFAMLFLMGPEGARLCATAGIPHGHAAAAPGRWALAEALAGSRPLRLDDIGARTGVDLPSGPWPRQPRSAVLLPVRPSVAGAPEGVLVVALNPFRALDDDYESFLSLVARQCEAALGVSVALDLAREREKAETALRAAAGRAAFLSGLGDALRDLGDPAAVMAEAAARLGRHLGLARSGYVENDLATGRGTVTADWTDGRTASARGSHDLAGYGAEVLALLRRGEAVVLPELPADTRLPPEEARDDKAHGGIRAAVGIPLVKGESWVATLFALDLRPRAWTPEEVDLIREVAERTWSALEAARAARALREGEAFTRDILEASNDCIKVLDLDGRLIFMSGGGQRIMELDDFSPFQGRPWPEVWPPAGRPLAEAAVARARDGGVSSFRGEAPTAKGNLRFWDVVVSPIRGEDGRTERLLSISRDITVQRRAEEALRESEKRFRTMADSAPVMVWTTGPDGRFTYVNRHWREFTGRPPSEVLDQGFRSAIHPDDIRATESVAVPARARREAFRLEYRLRRADGGYAWVIDTASPRLSGDGAFLGYTGSVIDITDRKRSEERRALLVNELNHRVKNTLATVQSLAAQSFRLGQVDRSVRDAFEARLQALSQAHDVLTRGDWEGAALHEIAERALAPFGGTDREPRRIAIEGPSVRLPPPMALALAMALHELATNATKHGALSEPGGRVDLSWDLAGEGRDRRLRLSWAEREGPPVEPPTRRGFGSRLIQDGLANELDGEVIMDYRATGVICRLDAPLPSEGTE